MRKILYTICCALFLFTAQTTSAQSYPDPQGFVNDFGNVLSDSEENQLEQKLQNYEAQTGNEIAVVTITSLEGQTIEGYAVELFERWGIGKQGEDNGALFLAAIEDREMRIEVGYGLEGYLTDVGTNRVLDNTVKPSFQNERYYQGINAATTQLIEAIDAEVDLNDQVQVTSDGNVSEFERNAEIVIQVIFFLVFLVIIIARARKRGGKGMVLDIISLILSFIFGGRGGGRGGGRSGFGGFGGGGSGGGGSSSDW